MDEARFVSQCTAWAPGLMRIALSILRTEADAQDALQQALMKAWAARDKARPGCEQAWLTRILVNECRSIQRQRMRVTPMADLPPRPAPTPAHDLRAAMDALPDHLRLPILLKYMQGMSEREAAQALGIPVTALKGRLYRARRALESILKEEVELE